MHLHGYRKSLSTFDWARYNRLKRNLPNSKYQGLSDSLSTMPVGWHRTVGSCDWYSGNNSFPLLVSMSISLWKNGSRIEGKSFVRSFGGEASDSLPMIRHCLHIWSCGCSGNYDSRRGFVYSFHHNACSLPLVYTCPDEPRVSSSIRIRFPRSSHRYSVSYGRCLPNQGTSVHACH